MTAAFLNASTRRRGRRGLVGQAQSLVLQGFLTPRRQIPLTAILKALLMAPTRGMMKVKRRKKRMMMMKKRWSIWL